MTGRRGNPVVAVTASVLALVLGACGSGSSAGDSAPVRARYSLPAGTSAADAQVVADRMTKRFEALGVRDVDVAAGGDEVVVRGDANATEVAPLVAGRGVLEFRPVLELFPPGGSVTELQSGETRLPASDRNAMGGVDYVVGPSAVTGRITSARPQFIPGGMGWTVQLTFDREGQQQFDALAQRLVGRQPPRNAVALEIDGAVESSPAFQSTSFPDGVAVSGNFTKREAEALAAALGSGPYPVKVQLRGATSSG